MPFRDLREFMDTLDETGELVRIKREVNPNYEIGAVVRKINDVQGPAVLFENVKDSRIPIVSNLFGTYKRIAIALDSAVEEVNRRIVEKIERYPVHPKLVNTGPVKDVVIEGEAIDLRKFPFPIWNYGDGGQYVTLGVQIAKDPETGYRNAGIYRMQIFSKAQMGIHANPPSHLGWFRLKTDELEKPLEVAVVIGCDPTVVLGAVSWAPYGWDELALASAYRDAPLELVRCETIDVEVPSTAEIVIEGRILPNIRHKDGPFGEFTGYMGPQVENPIFEVTAITHRRDPIYLGNYTGYPPTENQTLISFGRSPFLLRALKSLSPRVVDAYVTPESSYLHAVVKMRKTFREPAIREEAKRLIFGAFSTFYQIKRCIIVDEDIDILNLASVEWAVATRVRPDRDIFVVPECQNVPLDPSSEERGTGAKYGVDATRKYEDFPAVARPPEDLLKKIRLEDYLLE